MVFQWKEEEGQIERTMGVDEKDQKSIKWKGLPPEFSLNARNTIYSRLIIFGLFLARVPYPVDRINRLKWFQPDCHVYQYIVFTIKVLSWYVDRLVSVMTGVRETLDVRSVRLNGLALWMARGGEGLRVRRQGPPLLHAPAHLTLQIEHNMSSTHNGINYFIYYIINGIK